MKNFRRIMAAVAAITMVSTVPAMAGMKVEGAPISMTSTGHWTQVGNDWGYSFDVLKEEYAKYSTYSWMTDPLMKGGLVQEGAIRIDGDWYCIDKNTHTIKKNCWVTGEDSDTSSSAAGYTDVAYYACRTYFGADGKAEKVQFPLMNGRAVNGTMVYDESSSAVYDVVSVPDGMASSLIEAVNKYRTSKGLKALETDKMLLTTSKIFSTYLPMDSRYKHEMKYSYTGASGMVWDVYNKPYYRNTKMFMYDGSASNGGVIESQEFISVGKQDVNEIVNEWANQKLTDIQANAIGKTFTLDVTPNLLDKKATCIGAACYVDASGTPYWYMQIA